MIRLHLRRTCGALVAALLVTAGAGVSAGTYPDGPVRLLIPFGPGGGQDRVARLLAPAIAEALGDGVEVVPVNLPGAGGQKAALVLERSDPDGQTLLLANYPGVAAPALTGSATAYDPRRFTVIANVTVSRRVILTRADHPQQSVEEFVSLGSALKVLTSGKVSNSHLTSLVFWRALGVEPVMIGGYKGSSASIAGLLRGDGDVMAGALDSVLRKNTRGDFRLLAVLDPAPAPDAPPNGAALGHPELDTLASLRTLVGPPDLPDEIRDRLVEAVRTATSDPDLIAEAEAMNVRLEVTTGEEARALVDRLLDTLATLLTPHD